MLRGRQTFVLFPEILPVEGTPVAYPEAIPCSLCSSSHVLRDIFASDWLRSGLVLLAKKTEGEHLKGASFIPEKKK